MKKLSVYTPFKFLYIYMFFTLSPTIAKGQDTIEKHKSIYELSISRSPYTGNKTSIVIFSANIQTSRKIWLGFEHINNTGIRPNLSEFRPKRTYLLLGFTPNKLIDENTKITFLGGLRFRKEEYIEAGYYPDGTLGSLLTGKYSPIDFTLGLRGTKDFEKKIKLSFDRLYVHFPVKNSYNIIAQQQVPYEQQIVWAEEGRVARSIKSSAPSLTFMTRTGYQLKSNYFIGAALNIYAGLGKNSQTRSNIGPYGEAIILKFLTFHTGILFGKDYTSIQIRAVGRF